ncbi:hypothetical protein L6452_08826 [Arctium lappa]|uniref:Uncharacterized protein n=1 Tax=Arctium lappa TaxID=4217 RepID=A0ACB9DIA4_ARCLA|nr:hypothetical protein L6452_08826 [Arctium lappa]
MNEASLIAAKEIFKQLKHSLFPNSDDELGPNGESPKSPHHFSVDPHDGFSDSLNVNILDNMGTPLVFSVPLITSIPEGTSSAEDPMKELVPTLDNLADKIEDLSKVDDTQAKIFTAKVDSSSHSLMVVVSVLKETSVIDPEDHDDEDAVDPEDRDDDDEEEDEEREEDDDDDFIVTKV